MPVNRNALIRYKTIDNCLKRRSRKWTLEDLIDACSDALYEYEGIDKGVSKRTVQGDIQIMRSDKLGYNAPIIVLDKKYYTYEDPNYSITNIPLTDQDLGMLTDAVAFMKQFKGFSHFKDLDGMVQKLEDHIYSQKTRTKPVIDFEKNDNLKGLDFLDTLYKAIIKKEAIKITYQSFKARTANSFDFHPYLLKEFRNRWFLIGRKNEAANIFNLALDRIINLSPSNRWYEEDDNFDPEEYFKNAIGVSISPTQKAEEVLLYINHRQAPYVLTKPLHHSQKLVEKDHYGVTISLNVQLNYELEKAILGFGEGIKVLAPEQLKRTIKERINTAIDLYNTEISQKGLYAARQKLSYKGFAVLNYIYTRRELKLLSNKLNQLIGMGEKDQIRITPHLLVHQPKLKYILFNKNLKRLVHSIDPNAFLVKATYYTKSPKEISYNNWHQGGSIIIDKFHKGKDFINLEKGEFHRACPPDNIAKNVFCIKVHLDDTSIQNGQQLLIAGSHKKRLSSRDIELISNNSHPSIPELNSGTILLMNALLLSSFKSQNPQSRRRVIHLEFTSQELPEGLQWAEKAELDGFR